VLYSRTITVHRRGPGPSGIVIVLPLELVSATVTGFTTPPRLPSWLRAPREAPPSVVAGWTVLDGGEDNGGFDNHIDRLRPPMSPSPFAAKARERLGNEPSINSPGCLGAGLPSAGLGRRAWSHEVTRGSLSGKAVIARLPAPHGQIQLSCWTRPWCRLQ